MQTCDYCQEYKDTRVWSETQENVCYDCRLDMLEQEFFSKKSYPEVEQILNDLQNF